MKFHITITDNETGKVLHEADTSVIIGGYTTENGADALCLASCSDFDLSSAIMAAEKDIDAVKKQKGLAFAFATEMLPSIMKAAKEELEKSEDEKPKEDSNE